MLVTLRDKRVKEFNGTDRKIKKNPSVKLKLLSTISQQHVA